MPRHIRMIRRLRRTRAQAGRRVRGSGAHAVLRRLFTQTLPDRRDLTLFGAIHLRYDSARSLFRGRLPVARRLAVPSRAAA